MRVFEQRRKLAASLPAAALLLLTAPAPPLRAGAMTDDKTAASDAPRRDEWPRFELSLETAALFGLNNPADYQTLPQLLTLRWEPSRPWHFGEFRLHGQWLASAAAVAFTHGGEHHYFAGGIGGRTYLTKPDARWSLFFDGRFYVGAIDSKGPPYGQGQDLTFSVVGTLGVDYKVTPRVKVGAAFMYEHFSNANLSEPERPNIGLDTIGPNLSVSYDF
ncbi:MAG: acyloxyacyl hydrolase [Verrucomicrobia bacterium]|nr:acyloxyacyl hydrolase [Verrucomicrobiota bacterium]